MTRASRSRGLRDIGRLIDDYGTKPYPGPVWVANHYRAIADMAMDRICNWRWEAATFPAPQIDEWLPTVMYHADYDCPRTKSFTSD